MSSKNTLADQTADAYEHLYDIVYLRTHPLNGLLPPEPHLSRNEQAWRLHHYLLDLIGQLDPGAAAPAYSREWRRHRLMVLRYVDRLDPQEVADRLAISRRSYYRECAAAVEAVAELLWDRQEELAREGEGGDAAPEGQGASRLELLRLETARLAQAGRQSQLSEVIEDTLGLVREMARGKGITIEPMIGEVATQVAVAREVLRQILLGTLSYLIERMDDGGAITVSARESGDGVTLVSEVEGSRRGRSSDAAHLEGLSVLNELAAVQRCILLPLMDRAGIVGFSLTLPLMERRVVLVVDDNDDVLQLFRGYLTQHDFQVVTARMGSEALELARELQPFAITLDLMMPYQDGWDILQTLTNQHATKHIPVIICTVLSAKELALSLGAASFLEKPVTEQALISALSALSES